jgi:hypothetical protein
MSKPKWTSDPFAEQQMRKLNVKWEIKEVSIDDIDWDKSTANIARIGVALDRSFVDELLVGIRHGDRLPMPVLCAVGKKYVTFSGHHRLPAAKMAGIRVFDAYVFKTTDEAVLDNLHKMLNPPVRAVPKSDRLIFARDAVRKSGFTIAKAADLYTLDKKSLSDYIAAENTREKLAQLGVPDCTKIPRTSLEHLSRIKNANALRAAGRLVNEAKYTGEEIITLVRDIQAEDTEARQLGVIGEAEKSCGLDGAAVAPSPVCTKRHINRGLSTQVLRAITSLERHSNVRTINQWGFTETTQKAQVVARIKKLSRKLLDICKRSTEPRE